MASLPMYFPQSFPLATATTCAALVAAAYDQYTQWYNQNYPKMNAFTWTPSVQGYTYSAPLYWTYDLGFYQEPIGFLAVAQQGGTAYLVFRGTVSTQDQIQDALVTQTAYALASGFGNVHLGFYQIYEQLSPQVRQALATATANGALPQLVFTGHSLGCALSTLAVPDVVANGGLGQTPMLQLNLASPRVGDPTFAAAMNTGPVPTFRVVNTEDIVPDAPLAVGPASLFYTHIGTPVDFTANYLSIDGNHALVGAYTYALNNPGSPWDPKVAVAQAQTIAFHRAAPAAAGPAAPPAQGAAPTTVAQAVAARLAVPAAVHTTDAQGRVL